MNSLEVIEFLRQTRTAMGENLPGTMRYDLYELAIAALEKQIPDSAPAQFDRNGSLECGGCGSDTDNENVYCPYCGQRLTE